MGDGQNVASVPGIDPVQVGIMIGKLDTVIGRFDRLETNIENNYATKESVNELRGQIATLQNTPRVRRAEIIAILSCVFTGLGGVGAIVAAHWK